jgi:hypothetical protein
MTDPNPSEEKDPRTGLLPDLRDVIQAVQRQLGMAVDALSGCGLEHHASQVRAVLNDMRNPQGAVPAEGAGFDYFVVSATFLVPRSALYEVLAEIASSSGSWYRIKEAVQPQPRVKEGGQDRDSYQACPLKAGGALLISVADSESNTYRLDLFTISLGMEAMAVRYPKQFASLLTGEEGQLTADVLLQCCLFAKVIYGPLAGR